MPSVSDAPRVPLSRALVPVASRVPAGAPASLPALVQQVLPVVRRSVAAAAVGFVAEYALRSLANRALSGRTLAALTQPTPPAAPPAAPTATVRTVFLEVMIIERMRRSR